MSIWQLTADYNNNRNKSYIIYIDKTTAARTITTLPLRAITTRATLTKLKTKIYIYKKWQTIQNVWQRQHKQRKTLVKVKGIQIVAGVVATTKAQSAATATTTITYSCISTAETAVVNGELVRHQALRKRTHIHTYIHMCTHLYHYVIPTCIQCGPR